MLQLDEPCEQYMNLVRLIDAFVHFHFRMGCIFERNVYDTGWRCALFLCACPPSCIHMNSGSPRSLWGKLAQQRRACMDLSLWTMVTKLYRAD